MTKNQLKLPNTKWKKIFTKKSNLIQKEKLHQKLPQSMEQFITLFSPNLILGNISISMHF